jgi:hypothetical protein
VRNQAGVHGGRKDNALVAILDRLVAEMMGVNLPGSPTVSALAAFRGMP